ncbi:MAG: YqhA family protein [Microbacteriaceae bacterium]
MTEQPASPDPRSRRLEHGVERFLFAARWLLAPIYIGMLVALLAILVKFLEEIVALVGHVTTNTATDASHSVVEYSGELLILDVLALIDLGLLANLVLIVVFAGYENFVSKIVSARESEDRPTWMGHIDFSGLKMKLIGSIVAISAIGLLADFIGITDDDFDPQELRWRIALHIVFLLSGIGFAFMDWIGEKRLQVAQITHSGE